MKQSIILSIFLSLTISCNSESAKLHSSDASSALDAKDASITEPPEVSSPSKELPFTEVPHAAGVNDPICEVRCTGFWEKRGLWYLDGIVEPAFEMTAKCSINKAGKCCMQMRGALGPIKGGELTLEDEKGLIPLSKADATSSYELFDDGELLVFQFWEDDTLTLELDYTR